MEVSILCLSESFLNSTTFHKKGKLNLLKLDQRRKLQKTRYTEEVLQHLVHLNTIYFFLNAYMHDKPHVPGIIFSQVLGIEKKWPLLSRSSKSRGNSNRQEQYGMRSCMDTRT